jgi:nitroreductase
MLPKGIIEQIVEAGTFAPTGMNNQTPIIVAVTNKEVRDRLSAANAKIGGWKEGFDPFYGAPVVLIVLADKNSPHRVYDGSLVMENLMLAAHALNVGSCWIHRAKQEFEMPEWQEWLKSLGVNGEYEGIGHCILGLCRR